MLCLLSIPGHRDHNDQRDKRYDQKQVKGGVDCDVGDTFHDVCSFQYSRYVMRAALSRGNVYGYSDTGRIVWVE